MLKYYIFFVISHRFALQLPTIPIQQIFNCSLALNIKDADTMNVKVHKESAIRFNASVEHI